MKFQQIRSYDNYIFANLQLNLLKDQGISCYLQDEHTITIDPLLSPAIGGMKLMVVDPEADMARQMLDRADEEYLKTVACSGCGHVGLEKVTHIEKPEGFWQALKIRLISGATVSMKTHYHCPACGRQFDQVPV
ncbi:hypothetical protein ACFSQD_17200 [Flavihumibacter stibioxidans]|uniref:Signal transducing protein n=1 Tax=Flavihumibacter stibioxidans TaxID=1834163 RepID=A0ABR7MCT3_9BACT|nr:hypothetical protein [Flavihumibacter stibioxidans]MBC6492840.1 hypothetical protein [Flavihumibacter stibioxidans]